jgi:hypothetical protein
VECSSLILGQSANAPSPLRQRDLPVPFPDGQQLGIIYHEHRRGDQNSIS